MNKKGKGGIISLIVFLLLMLAMGIVWVGFTPKDNSVGSQVVISFGNSIIWVAVILLLFIALIGILALLKYLGILDNLFSEARL